MNRKEYNKDLMTYGTKLKKAFSVFLIFVMLFSIFTLSACDINFEEESNEPKVEEPIVTVDPIKEKIDSMTLEEKIGQMFIIKPDALLSVIPYEDRNPVNQNGFIEVTDEIQSLYDEYPVGGFVLFAKNIKDPEQLTKLTSDLHALNDIKPLLTIDEEGGDITRIARNEAFDVAKFSTMEEIAINGNSDDAKTVGKEIGKYLDYFGLDLDFAPVSDVNTNPENTVIGNRAFGSDPKVAAAMVSSAINGFHESNTLTCIKHFPGHGDTKNDTHKGYAESNKTWDEMLKLEMLPFISGIEAGTDMVMVAHITTPNATTDNMPSTLSKEMITGKLRNELGYDGVVITDSMAMKAITKYYSSEEASVLAIEAGVDIILIPNNYRKAFDGVKEAVLSGRISEDRIDESLYRILKLKEKNQ